MRREFLGDPRGGNYLRFAGPDAGGSARVKSLPMVAPLVDDTASVIDSCAFERHACAKPNGGGCRTRQLSLASIHKRILCPAKPFAS